MSKKTNIELSKECSILLKQGSTSPMPQKITPMLATLASQPFNSPDWLFEVKWDGFRTLAFDQQDDVSLMSRKSYSKYYPIKRISRLKFQCSC